MTSLPPVSFSEATRTWMRVGFLSFGGPAGQIAVMHRILVQEKRWLSEQRFMHALSYCMLLPGPEAQQLATYVGWLLHGIRGGLVAGILFVLPGLIAMMILSLVYVIWQQHPLLSAVFLGLKAAVIALVVDALLRIGRRALQDAPSRWIAGVSFLAIATLKLPFPLIVIAAGVAGYLRARGSSAPTVETAVPLMPTTPTTPATPRQTGAGLRHALTSLAVWLPIWFAPVAVAAMLLGPGHVFTQLGLFFSQMAVVTFGGAYAVLSYVAQQAVEHFGWVTSGQMLDGLGLAETTPGPLILAVQFVGFLAAFQTAGGDSPWLAGVIGALITVWVTFVPSFLWIFLGAPHVERLRTHRALSGALQAITAAVVGVIANLALWFAVRVWFSDVRDHGMPDPTSIQWTPAALTVIALLLTFAVRAPLGITLLVSASLGAATILLPG